MNTALLKQHQDYIARAEAHGARVMSYSTPCCGEKLDTTVPKTAETWDSLTTCPHCGRLFMKICRRNQVETFLAATPAANHRARRAVEA